MHNMAACTPTSVTIVTFMSPGYDQASSLLHRSAQIHAPYELVVLPWNRSENYLQKVSGLRDFIARGLAQRELCPSSVVLMADAYDSFLTTGATRLLQTFLAMKAGVVMSVERLWSWQLEEDRSFYDNISVGRGAYRYINSGGIIGHARALLPLVSRAQFVRYHKGADQAAYSHLIAERRAEFDVSFDYDSRVFLVLSGEDWYNHSPAHARMKAARPCMVHVPGARDRRANSTLHEFYRRHASPSPPPPTATASSSRAAVPQYRDPI